MAINLWGTEEVGLFDINFDTGEQYWSYELRHILGVPRHTPADFHLLLQRVHLDDRRAFCEIAMQVFRPDCPVHRVSEFRIVHGDGGTRWVHTERISIFRSNAAHDVVRIVGFVIEIPQPTKRQRAWQLSEIAA